VLKFAGVAAHGGGVHYCKGVFGLFLGHLKKVFIDH
jgi:hypothetical protein